MPIIKPLPETSVDRGGDVWVALDTGRVLPTWFCITTAREDINGDREDLAAERGPLRPATLTIEVQEPPVRVDVWQRGADGLWRCVGRGGLEGLPWSDLKSRYGEMHLIDAEPLDWEPV
jgi:hypothetical protein